MNNANKRAITMSTTPTIDKTVVHADAGFGAVAGFAALVEVAGLR